MATARSAVVFMWGSRAGPWTRPHLRRKYGHEFVPTTPSTTGNPVLRAGRRRGRQRIGISECRSNAPGTATFLDIEPQDGWISAAMNDDNAAIWLTERHSLSGRSVVLEDDGESCWLYLCEHDSNQILRSAFAYSPMPPANVQRDVDSGETPVLMMEFASADAVIVERYPDDFSFRWRPDGDAVAVCYRDQVIAIASMDE